MVDISSLCGGILFFRLMIFMAMVFTLILQDFRTRESGILSLANNCISI